MDGFVRELVLIPRRDRERDSERERERASERARERERGGGKVAACRSRSIVVFRRFRILRDYPAIESGREAEQHPIEWHLAR
jgi:hypothetical protein